MSNTGEYVVWLVQLMKQLMSYSPFGQVHIERQTTSLSNLSDVLSQVTKNRTQAKPE